MKFVEKLFKLVGGPLVSRHWMRSYVSQFFYKLAFCCSKVKFCDRDEDSPEFSQFSSQCYSFCIMLRCGGWCLLALCCIVALMVVSDDGPCRVFRNHCLA